MHALWLLQCWRVCPVDVIFGGGSVSVLEISEKPVATWAWVPALSSAYSSRCACPAVTRRTWRPRGLPYFQVCAEQGKASWDGEEWGKWDSKNPL